MTDITTNNGSDDVEQVVIVDDVLPTELEATMAFVKRMPSQRVIDTISKLEGGVPIVELLEQQPSRVLAFRVLLRDYPLRDPTSLWMHAYDCEVDLLDVDPTSLLGQTTSLPSALTGT